jgi:hypothetical protein
MTDAGPETEPLFESYFGLIAKVWGLWLLRSSSRSEALRRAHLLVLLKTNNSLAVSQHKFPLNPLQTLGHLFLSACVSHYSTCAPPFAPTSLLLSYLYDGSSFCLAVISFLHPIVGPIPTLLPTVWLFLNY